MSELGRLSKSGLDLSTASRDAIAEALAEIALACGPVIMEIYLDGCSARAKSDGSPVTEADERAEAIIEKRLRELAANVPVVAEEAVAAGAADDFRPRIFSRRSRRWHTGIPQAKWRIHCQRGAGAGRRADRGRGIRSCFGPNLGRRRQRLDMRGSLGRAVGGAGTSSNSDNAQSARQIDRARQPLPSRFLDGGVSAAPAHRRSDFGGIELEVLRCRRWAGGRLSAVRADHGMGYSGRRRCSEGGGRGCSGQRRRAPSPTGRLRPGSKTGLSSPGAIRRPRANTVDHDGQGNLTNGAENHPTLRIRGRRK